MPAARYATETNYQVPITIPRPLQPQQSVSGSLHERSSPSETAFFASVEKAPRITHWGYSARSKLQPGEYVKYEDPLGKLPSFL